jgi:hypothetical protein
MIKTYYSQQPTKFERGKQCAIIRLDINKESVVAAADETEGDPQWSAYEFRRYEPITQNIFIEEIFTRLYGNDYENKLINEYNAAKMGLYPDGEMEQKITRYRAFLQERAERKAEIERICNENGIK